MFKYFAFNLLFLFCGASVIQVPQITQNVVPLERSVPTRDIEQIFEKWEPHLKDFLSLIEVDELTKVVMKYVSDPDVMNFVSFVASPKFKEMVLEFEDLDEFKEAVDYLQSKNYDIKSIIEFINDALTPPFLPTNTQEPGTSGGKGITNLIKDIIQVLPVEEIKKLLQEKVENSPEIADLFDALTTDEFRDIVKRLNENPKVLEMKKVFESYGFDFDELNFINGIIGDDF